jgi:hypothetical protein
MGYYAAPFSMDFPHGEVYPGASPWPPPSRSPRSSLRMSSFPLVPPLVALVAPAPSAPGDTIGAIAALVHVRRCDDIKDAGINADGIATDGRATAGRATAGRATDGRATDGIETNRPMNQEAPHASTLVFVGKNESMRRLVDRLPGAPQLDGARALAKGFYPTLPASYYLAALAELCGAKRNKGADSSEPLMTKGIRVVKEVLRGDVVIVTPSSCRKSPLVQSLVAAYPGQIFLAPSPTKTRPKNQRVSPGVSDVKSSDGSGVAHDFALLRGAPSALVLSVGTFGWWAAWLRAGDQHGHQGRGVDAARSLHVPLAGCQRRFVPFHFNDTETETEADAVTGDEAYAEAALPDVGMHRGCGGFVGHAAHSRCRPRTIPNEHSDSDMVLHRLVLGGSNSMDSRDWDCS